MEENLLLEYFDILDLDYYDPIDNELFELRFNRRFGKTWDEFLEELDQ